MRTMDRLKAAAIRRKSTIKIESYKQIRNKMNLLNKLLKRSITLRRFPPITGNLKESWKMIKELLNKRSKSYNIDCLKDADNVVTPTEDIPNVMNSCF